MKTLLLYGLIVLFPSLSVFAQMYDISQYPNGTTTISELKQKYSSEEIKNMLEKSEIYRNSNIKEKIGIGMTDSKTSEKLIICDTDSILLIFEYLKKLRQELVTLNNRLQAQGIP